MGAQSIHHLMLDIRNSKLEEKKSSATEILDLTHSPLAQGEGRKAVYVSYNRGLAIMRYNKTNWPKNDIASSQL